MSDSKNIIKIWRREQTNGQTKFYILDKNDKSSILPKHTAEVLLKDGRAVEVEPFWK